MNEPTRPDPDALLADLQKSETAATQGHLKIFLGMCPGVGKTYAMLLDAQFQVAGIRFGMDAIVGLIPGVGDLLTTLAGAYPLYLAHRHSLGRWTLARMAGNLTLDFLAGSVPVVGDLFDVAFKANLKNLAILEAAAAKQKARHR